MKPRFFGVVKGGTLSLADPKGFANYVHGLEGEIELVIGKRRKHRSDRQNRYYWKVIVGMLSTELGYSDDETHEALKWKFLLRDEGKIPTVRSTANLSTAEFESYLGKIREWASSFLGCEIPLPNEVEFGG